MNKINETVNKIVAANFSDVVNACYDFINKYEDKVSENRDYYYNEISPYVTSFVAMEKIPDLKKYNIEFNRLVAKYDKVGRFSYDQFFNDLLYPKHLFDMQDTFSKHLYEIQAVADKRDVFVNNIMEYVNKLSNDCDNFSNAINDLDNINKTLRQFQHELVELSNKIEVSKTNTDLILPEDEKEDIVKDDSQFLDRNEELNNGTDKPYPSADRFGERISNYTTPVEEILHFPR